MKVVVIKVSTLSSTSGNSGLMADSFKPRGKNLGTWDILVNFRTDLLLYSLRYLCLLKFNTKDKGDSMLIYFRQDKTRQCFIWSLIQSCVYRLYPNNFILLGEEVGGDEGLPSLKKPPDPGVLKNVLYEGVPALPFYLPFLTEKVPPF